MCVVINAISLHHNFTLSGFHLGNDSRGGKIRFYERVRV